MDKNTKLSQYLLQMIQASEVYFTGSCGGVNSDGTVNVKRQGGNSVNAIAANITGSGDCSVFLVEGQYYAFSASGRVVTNERSVINRHSKPIDVTKKYTVKILFYYDSDGIHLDFYIGGDRSNPRKILSLDKTGLIYPDYFNTYSLALGGITNLGKEEMITIETETATSQNYILRKSDSTKQIAFEKTAGRSSRVYLGNGAFHAFFGLGTGESKLIYDSDQTIILPFTRISSYQNDFFGRRLVTQNFTQTVKFWTPDRLITDYIYTREFVSSTAAPGSLPDSGTTYSNFKEHSQGYFLVQKTSDGYITQDFASDGEFVEQDIFGYYVNLTPYNQFSTHRITKETKNVLTYFRVNQEPLILNNSDFFIIKPSPNGQPLITKDSTVVTITATAYVKPLIPDPALFYERDYLDPSNISGKILFNWSVDGAIGLIKGEVSNVSIVRGIEGVETTPVTISITISISSIISNTSTDFQGSIISDNGSFYSYYFRKALVGSSSGMINKSVMPAINLQQPVDNYSTTNIDPQGTGGSDTIKNYISDYLKTDNFAGNKIYSVISTSKIKANIAQWNISDNGDVNFNKIFTVDYFQPNPGGQTLGYSYHP